MNESKFIKTYCRYKNQNESSAYEELELLRGKLDYDRMAKVLQYNMAKDINEIVECSTLNIDNYGNVVRKIGEGGFMNVYLVIDKLGYKWAAKRLKNTEDKKLRYLMGITGFTKEIILDKFTRNHIQNLLHSNICPLDVILDIDTKEKIVLEEYMHHNLLDLLKRKKLNEKEAIIYLTQITSGLLACHSYVCMGKFRPIVHGDLKPSNLGIKGRIKLFDFGNSLILNGQDKQGLIPGIMIRAPELFKNKFRISTSIDLYALGVIGAWMVLGYPPPLINSEKYMNLYLEGRLPSSETEGRMEFEEYIKKTVSDDNYYNKLFNVLKNIKNKDFLDIIKVILKKYPEARGTNTQNIAFALYQCYKKVNNEDHTRLRIPK